MEHGIHERAARGASVGAVRPRGRPHANATALKKDVIEIINDKIVIYLRAMEIVVPDTYGNFARTIAQIIADNNEVVKKRRKKDEPED